MCRENPSLLDELNRKKASDTTFAKNPMLILNWFYNKSPYADPRKNVYPVGKIYEKSIVDGLQKD